MENSTKCSVLVTSCDAYEDAWKPFFTLFHNMWPACKYPIYLNTETKEYCDNKIVVQTLHPKSLLDEKGKPVSWSKRLKEAVEQIGTEYILFFLEDFFLMSPVREDVVNSCIRHMDEHEDIVVFDFYNEYHEDEIVFGEFSPINKKYDFAVNTMAALWRRSFLLSILRDENPWDFEFFATRRWLRTNYKILTHREEFPPVFNYRIKPEYGYGIYRGKWLRNNPILFKEYGIDIDFEKRGFADPPTEKGRIREKNWFLHDVSKMIKHPKIALHYLQSVRTIIRYNCRKFKAKYFNK